MVTLSCASARILVVLCGGSALTPDVVTGVFVCSVVVVMSLVCSEMSVWVSTELHIVATVGLMTCRKL